MTITVLPHIHFVLADPNVAGSEQANATSFATEFDHQLMTEITE